MEHKACGCCKESLTVVQVSWKAAWAVGRVLLLHPFGTWIDLGCGSCPSMVIPWCLGKELDSLEAGLPAACPLTSLPALLSLGTWRPAGLLEALPAEVLLSYLWLFAKGADSEIGSPLGRDLSS